MARRSPAATAAPPASGAAAPKRPPRRGQDAARARRAALRRLGEALERRSDAVLARTLGRTQGSALAPEVLGRFEQFNVRSTVALARWLAGERREVAREAGQETWRFYGGVAAEHEVSLHEILTRCLAWRDAVAETLREIAAAQPVPPAALEHALQTLQQSVEHSLVRIARATDAERERIDRELAFMATHDPLTGLPNRSLIVDRTEQLLLRSRRHGTPVAALILGLDNLRDLSETLGREKGEELLRAIAERLGGCVRETDALGRLGEHEFAVIVEGDALGEGSLRLAERLRETLREPFQLAGDAGRVTVSCCIGVASGPRPGAHELIGDAEIAMRHIRWEGRHGIRVFEPGMEQAVEARRELEVDLHWALAREEFELAYQPIAAIDDLRVTGMEALLRWRHPLRGAVPPGTFIPLLEESERIVEVGGWVLAQACSFAATAGAPVLLAVNVSARQLEDERLLGQVRAALAASGLQPSSLTLEMTETALMRNVEAAAAALRALHDLGVRVAVDDFGTGYSSLSHLQRFPIDELKIDRSFVSRLDGAKPETTLVRTMLQLGKELRMQTVAEGIETPEQLRLLREWGCDRAQGFLLARPLDPGAMAALLRSPVPVLEPAPGAAEQ